MIVATLLTDGSSDRVLVPLLEWVVSEATDTPARVGWADLRGHRRASSLHQRVQLAVEWYPCNLLFVHRDAEAQPPDWRRNEIASAAPRAPLHVAVVPVRMQEAWLLHDEASIRRAAGRPSGTESLDVPRLERLEACPNPKAVLHQALITASGRRGRRRQSFDPAQAAHRVAMLVTDWSPLRRLPAFASLERDTRAALVQLSVPLRAAR